MKKMIRENKQLELPVLTALNSRIERASAPTSCAAQPAVNRAAHNQPDSHKEAGSGDLSIYQAITSSYFSKRS